MNGLSPTEARRIKKNLQIAKVIYLAQYNSNNSET